MKTVRGDLLVLARAGTFDVVVHGCNCFCTMGKGIALQIKREHPEAFAADCKTAKGDPQKLGTCSMARVDEGSHSFVIVNAYTQHHWRGAGPLANEEAIASCMRWVAREFRDQRIGLPRIGAGLAGGDWARIARIIDDALAGMDVTLVEYDAAKSAARR
jgi:O-acetyl-ADP-ribose deacetylase (regulator of RNase III)